MNFISADILFLLPALQECVRLGNRVYSSCVDGRVFPKGLSICLECRVRVNFSRLDSVFSGMYDDAKTNFALFFLLVNAFVPVLLI